MVNQQMLKSYVKYYPKILSIGMTKLSTGMAFEKYLRNYWSDWSETNGCQILKYSIDENHIIPFKKK